MNLANKLGLHSVLTCDRGEGGTDRLPTLDGDAHQGTLGPMVSFCSPFLWGRSEAVHPGWWWWGISEPSGGRVSRRRQPWAVLGAGVHGPSCQGMVMPQALDSPGG